MPVDADESTVRALYAELLDAWNRGDAAGYAACFAEEAIIVGFDGSEMRGRAEVESQIGAIFRDHKVATYVSIVRDVRAIASGVMALHANVGMVPPGADDLNPAVNAVQLLVACDDGGPWKIASFQNTPAAFHGRPQLAEWLTDELRAALRRMQQA